MRILLVGATGLLGRSVREVLEERGHKVVTASRRDPGIAVDITDPDSITAMYDRAGPLDAVAVAAGWVPWKPFRDLTAPDVRGALGDKVFGQVELVRQGAGRIAEEGSFTLVSGVLARDPLPTGSMAALANGALEAFVRAAAIELPHRQRVNAVSATVFAEAMDAYESTFAGYEAVPVRRAALAYVRSVEGGRTGHVFVVE
ncbi:short chain dehydrogenase [Actinomadura kijaniata]|uniref:short chain dehydrogenase n=1 Tax=Actinomadura kijaniata TaxID=46161 RepID=UPI00083311FE|nr:short chain dehydrogenase [Actinomadura kijaniata]